MSVKSSIARPCIICGSPTRELIDPELKKPRVVVYDVCGFCEFIRKRPDYHVSPTEEKTLYTHHNNTIENTGYVNMFKRFIAAAIDPFITKGKGLEFGSGPGPVLYELLKEKGFTMSHYDPYFHKDETVFQSTYDLITSTEVFEHLSDPMEVLTTLTGLLNPGGFLAIMTSFHKHDDDDFLSWWYRRDPTHIAFYTEETFAHMIQELKLTIHFTNQKNIIVFKKHT